MSRIATHLLVGALRRRVELAGGQAMLLARGEAMGGGVLVLLLDRGERPRFLEPGLGPDGARAMIATGPAECDSQAADSFWRKRRQYDPDLWVIEVDVPDGERFAAETILPG
jgi:hypothetical protein